MRLIESIFIGPETLVNLIVEKSSVKAQLPFRSSTDFIQLYEQLVHFLYRQRVFDEI